MKKIIAILLAAAALLALASCRRIDREFVSTLDNNPGFSGIVRMTQDGETIYEAVGGVEKASTREPITVDTRFCIGSVSKQFAAAAILTLQQNGKLSVDDPLSRFFPDYAYGNRLTIRHLLDMRSGIKEFYDVEYIDNAFTELPTGELRDVITNDKTVEENQKTLEAWLMKQPLQFEPDTDFEYSNSNYFLLARIVEIVSGKPYNDYVRETIFEPLGMTHTSFVDDTDFRNVPHLAAPTVHPQTVYVGVTMGLGDMISNAADMDRWMTSLRTCQVLTKESVALMGTDYTESPDEDYGFGIRMLGSGLFHSGSITTYQAMIYTDTATGTNIFAVTNDEPHLNVSVSDVVWDLLDQKNSEEKA